jgi:hypothetical protein
VLLITANGPAIKALKRKTKDKSHKTKGVQGSRFKVQEPLQLEIAICDLKILTSSLVSININDGEKKRKLDQASAPSVTW